MPHKRFRMVYGLIDPRTGELRYVGKSSSGLARPREHFAPGAMRKPQKLPVGRWCKKLHDLGLCPEIEILELASTPEDLKEREVHWIGYARFIGCRLLNLTRGGEGTVGYRHTPETKAKQSALKLGKQLSPEHRQNMSAANALRGRAMPDSNRLAIARAKGGRAVVDQNGNVYSHAAEAARALGLCRARVGKVLRGLNKHTSGYVFRYAD